MAPPPLSATRALPGGETPAAAREEAWEGGCLGGARVSPPESPLRSDAGGGEGVYHYHVFEKLELGAKPEGWFIFVAVLF